MFFNWYMIWILTWMHHRLCDWWDRIKMHSWWRFAEATLSHALALGIPDKWNMILFFRCGRFGGSASHWLTAKCLPFSLIRIRPIALVHRHTMPLDCPRFQAGLRIRRSHPALKPAEGEWSISTACMGIGRAGTAQLVRAANPDRRLVKGSSFSTGNLFFS